MGLTKSKGNMYDWVDFTHSHLEGKCGHECEYCYVQAMAKRFPNMAMKYGGPVRLNEAEFDVEYPAGKTVFVEHMNDICGPTVKSDWTQRIIEKCAVYTNTQFIFQSKNTKELFRWVPRLPCRSIVGTTIETNRIYPAMGKTPTPFSRAVGLRSFIYSGVPTFITIEPVLDFDLDMFLEMLVFAQPDFVNIGADSKGHGLIEPPYEKVMKLYDGLCAAGIEVRKKINLERLQQKA